MKNVNAVYKGLALPSGLSATMMFKDNEGRYYRKCGYHPGHKKGDSVVLSVDKGKVNSVTW